MSDIFDYSNLKFALWEKAELTKMYMSEYKNGAWDQGKMIPFQNISLSPAANVLNYGQGIFEGLKAYRSEKGRVVLFRPEENAKRFVKSAHRFAIPGITEEQFMNAVLDTVRANCDYIPESHNGKYSLYMRPVCIGSEALLGVRASEEYLFYIYAMPVGPYFDKVGVVKLVAMDYHRAAPKGTGYAKAVSNYAATMYPKKEAKKMGFDDVLYLDPKEDKYIEEAGAANFFALMEDGTLVTPPLGSILPGITRDSIIKVARDVYGMKVEERPLPVEEVVHNAIECFVCGTAAVITSVSDIGYKDHTYNVNKNDFQLAHKIYDKIVSIQLEKDEDPFGWIYPVK
ncbi:MAG: branched-chain amino acid aminotransferase [Calditrichia bacterium]